jgi:PqqD family protein of HPr-rel-A system
LLWRAVSAEALAWRDFDGQSVVRNAHTGSTHLLEAFPAEVLRTLVEVGDFLSAAEVAARLAGEPAGGDDFEEWEIAIQKMLKEFERLGLAEPQSA